MSNSLKKLGDFNEVIEYYQDVLNYVRRTSPRATFSARAPKFSLAYDRAIINNIAISIAQNFDFIEEYNHPDIDKVILDELEEFCRDTKTPKFKQKFKDIMDQNSLTPFETLKQIRNAFLHGDYELNIHTPSDFEIYVDENEKINYLKFSKAATLDLNGQSIKASFDYPESIHLIESFYECVRLNRFPPKNIEYSLSKLKHQSCRSRAELEKFLEGLSIYEIIPIGTEEQGNRGEIIKGLLDVIERDYPELTFKVRDSLWDIMKNMGLTEIVTGKNKFELKMLDKEELDKRRAFLGSYIEYLGLDTWGRLTRMPSMISSTVYHDFYASTYGHTSFSGISNRCCFAIRNYNVGLIEGKDIKNNPWVKMQYAIMLHEVPIVYSNLTLAMLNYSCGYLKENNSNEGCNIFDYHNLDDLNWIAPSIDTTSSVKRGISSEALNASIESQISALEKQKKNIEKSIEKISKNINDKNPKKSKFEEDKAREENRLREIEQRINGLRVRKSQYGATYDDYSEFFRHMRNSIAHGRYSIDYSKALKTKDFSKIKFTFRDYDNDDKVNPSFEITLTAKQVHKIVNCVKDKVNSQTQLEGSNNIIDKTKIKDYFPPEDLIAIKQSKRLGIGKPSDSEVDDGKLVEEEK